MKLQYFILILAFFGLVWSTSTNARERTSKTAVFLEIIDGDTAFIVDSEQVKAWWVVGECRKPIPINSQKQTNNSIISSDVISEDVLIGSRQVTLRQQFRFNMAEAPNGQYSVEVYNSLRGGWSQVPVQVKANCAVDAACRSRMEYPEC